MLKAYRDEVGVWELIETLWNVNFVAKLKRPSLLAELIETLWNVNMLKQKDTSASNSN